MIKARKEFGHSSFKVDFTESTWQAFWLTAVDGLKPKEAAEQVGLSVGAVYIARTRVTARLKEEVATLSEF